MRGPLDLRGHAFGRLTALYPTKLGRHRAWACWCACGQKTVTTTRRLRAGRVISCGCRRAEVLVARVPTGQFGADRPRLIDAAEKAQKKAEAAR